MAEMEKVDVKINESVYRLDSYVYAFVDENGVSSFLSEDQNINVGCPVFIFQLQKLQLKLWSRNRSRQFWLFLGSIRQKNQPCVHCLATSAHKASTTRSGLDDIVVETCFAGWSRNWWKGYDWEFWKK